MSKVVAILAICLLAMGCSKESAEIEMVGSALSFSAACSVTRVETTHESSTWESDDLVGISSSDGNNSNIRYKAELYGNAMMNFIFDDDSESEIMIAEKEGVTYSAYYPYSSSSDDSLTSDVSDQSDLGAIDCLWATGAIVDDSGLRPYVEFDFKHLLSMLRFEVSGYDDYTSLTIKLCNVTTEATYNFSDGSWTSSKTRDLTCSLPEKTTNEDDEKVFMGTAIVNPIAFESSAQLQILSGETEINTISLSDTFTPAANTIYTVKISSNLDLYAVNVKQWSEESPTLGELTGADIIYNTPDDLYEIYTSNGLQAFASLVNGTSRPTGVVCGGDSDMFVFDSAKSNINGKLMADIIGLPSSWTKIGNGTSFSGYFNFNEYSVTSATGDTIVVMGIDDLFDYSDNATIINIAATSSL